MIEHEYLKHIGFDKVSTSECKITFIYTGELKGILSIVYYKNRYHPSNLGHWGYTFNEVLKQFGSYSNIIGKESFNRFVKMRKRIETINNIINE